MAVPAAEFTHALASAANGVTVVTTDGHAGKAGLTVSSMCSVCAEPPLMLACVNADNEFCARAEANGHFAINLLNTEQVELCKVFAGLTDANDTDRFEHGEWTQLTTGSPILTNALTSLDCELQSSSVQGTHRLFIGKVVGIHNGAGTPLVYFDRQFAGLSRRSE